MLRIETCWQQTWMYFGSNFATGYSSWYNRGLIIRKQIDQLDDELMLDVFNRILHENFDPNTVTAPFSNDTVIQIDLVLKLMASSNLYIMDEKGVFLKRWIKNCNEISCANSGSITVLLSMKTFIGLKQTEMKFLRILIKIMNEFNSVDPCTCLFQQG